MNRISRKRIDEITFPALCSLAESKGVNAVGWSFGRPYGTNYVMTNAEGYIISPVWCTLREAYDGMQAMMCAYGTLS